MHESIEKTVHNQGREAEKQILENGIGKRHTVLRFGRLS
jgi:hypothetical protein